MQHLQDIFGTTHLVEPVMYQCGSAGKRTVSHAGLRAAALSDGMKGVGSGFEMSHHNEPATGSLPADIASCGTTTRPAE